MIDSTVGARHQEGGMESESGRDLYWGEWGEGAARKGLLRGRHWLREGCHCSSNMAYAQEFNLAQTDVSLPVVTYAKVRPGRDKWAQMQMENSCYDSCIL